VRCLVVGNEVVAAIERRAKRAISALTCTAAAWRRWPRSAIRSVRWPSGGANLGLDVAGVDILRATRGPLVMEVNASPGLEGIETTTGVDIAGKMIAWIERQATPEFCLKMGG
jgi:ribosomal protein S6--L-glutamate ligase